MKIRRTVASTLVVALLSTMAPVQTARAGSESAIVLYGLLTAALVSLGIMAYDRDYGRDNKPLEVPDQRDPKRQKDTTLLLAPPPPAEDEEARGNEVAAGIALAARF